MRRGLVSVTVGLLAATSALVSVAAGTSPRGQSTTEPAVAPPRALLVAEDARAETRDEAAPILRAMGDPSTRLARRAVLALGRLENPLFLPDIRRALSDADAGVRAEAVHALAHAARLDPAVLAPALRERLEHERAPEVRGVLLETLGRLAYKTPAERAAAEPMLVAALAAETSPLAESLGAAEGIEDLIRGARNTPFKPAESTLDALRNLARSSGRPALTAEFARLRRLAVSALNAAGAVDARYARVALDRDEQVRRLVVAGVGRADAPGDLRTEVVTRALGDESAMVRYEALRVHGRYLASEDCSAELDALGDSSLAVALLAIDLLGTTCPSNIEGTNALSTILAGFGIRDSGLGSRPWNRAAHALVSLARRDADAAKKHLPAFAAHPVWQIRASAARAGAILGDAGTLETLVGDGDDNVREAAIEGLTKVKGRDADALLRLALKRPAYQVTIAAAKGLQGTPDRRSAAAALLEALGALTARAEDTSRDARAAIFDRLEEVGAAEDAESLQPYLADRDPQIADRAARLLSTWTGTAHQAQTRRVTPLRVPSQDELDRLPAGMRVVMAGGESFDVAFDTWEATLTVWRLARLVQRGYYDGLTFHRVVPNFVIQGGSPGANEYVGDGSFMRDACSLRSNLQYSIGISTRGRDTGDAQFYVNLVDNERLDHNYPVFGEVVRGTRVVDRIAEGDVIERVELLRTSPGLVRD